ncbi:hypothetical protein [Pseudoduganella lutea]|uniref:Uncharacterized protein n=1 Tax=Pseudoduganella lutea TaxID=321985 RepID=A0A4P6KUG6_9BURK|nr:hypothetical protein [Pseudoduganella lutea]QBE61728.1 hypothetical protein EWM63_00875 [Pseudoduganella lutea]
MIAYRSSAVTQHGAHSINQSRRSSLMTGARWLAASAWLLSPLTIGPALAQTPKQRDWRYCHKCHAMFFNGYPAKGVCKAGGAHEAAGFNFVLPHGVPETATAQSNWRYCGKCQALFFNGFPGKGVCAADGGPHVAAGYTFTLPHSAAETPVAQASWRFCHKCMLMFYDGFPDKGKCNAGGGHAAAGLVFVLAHATNYRQKLQALAQQPARMQEMLQIMWDGRGKALLTEHIDKAIRNRGLADGVNIKDPHVNLGSITSTVRQLAPDRYAVGLAAPGNNIKFDLTTPTVFGSYGDPSFRVGFKMLVNLEIAYQQGGSPPVVVTVVDARVHDSTIHGANAVGTIAETAGDFITKGGFSRSVTEAINANGDFKPDLSKAITAAMNKVNA